ELGSGEGHFIGLLKARGVHCWGMDLRHPAGGVVCDLVGDARHAPIKPSSMSLVVAANLVRHITPRHRLLEYLTAWRSLLKPGGLLYLFEDEPSASLPAERNFRDLQEFLSRLMPESRGPLMSLDRFKSLLSESPDAANWTFGCQANEVTIDATTVVRFLAAGQGSPTGKQATLLRAIGRDGVSPGRYWYARVGPVPPEMDIK
ncbi:MAG: hypothetical protein ACI8S7_001662, partial [Candidatus Krumholzibacteriia bacterium]